MNKYSKYTIVVAVVLLCALQSCNNKKVAAFTNPEVGSNESVSKDGIQTENAKKTLTASEFIKWCADPENNLNKTKEISELRYNLMYLPSESMAFLELRTEKYDGQKFKEACDHYSDMTYFDLKIEIPEASGEILKYNLTSPSVYDQRIKYISFGMQQDIFLLQGKDTLRPGLYQYERIFEVAPFANVQLAFDNKKFDKNKEFTICYNDKLFEKGYIKFNYQNRQLTNVPTISGL